MWSIHRPFTTNYGPITAVKETDTKAVDAVLNTPFEHPWSCATQQSEKGSLTPQSGDEIKTASNC